MKQMKKAVAIGMIGIGLAVALARAQESENREPGLFQIEKNGAPRRLEPTPAIQRKSAFIQDTEASPSQLRSSAFDTPSTSSTQAATEAPRKPSAADRLKQIRSSSTAGGARPGASVVGPATSNPAELDQTSTSDGASISTSERIRVGDSSDAGAYSTKGTVSVLKKPEGGAPADRTTARRILRTPTKNTQPSAPAANTPAHAPLSSKKSSVSRTESGTLATSQGPALRVDTEGPATMIVGKESTYTVTIYNEGNIPANEVLVRVGLPTSLRVIAEGSISEPGAPSAGGQTQRFIWSIPRIEGNGAEKITLRVTAVENQPVELMVDWTTRPTPAVAQIQVQQPQLDLAISGPRDVLFGETATYVLRISNPGTGDAEDIAVDFGYGDFRLEPKRINALAPGQHIELKVELNATQAGPIQVAAVATAANGLRVDANQDVLVRRAKLEVDIVGDPVAFAGSPAGYQIQVRNTGDAPATEVVAAIKVPQNAQASIAGDSNKPSDEGLLVNIGSLPPNGERTIEMQCVLASPGENQIAVHAMAATQIAAAANFTTKVEALADLKLSVNDPTGPVALGKEAVYEIHIANRGTKAATKVNVVAQFSEGIEPFAATGAQAEVVRGQVVFQMIPRIDPGQELTLIVRARGESEGNKRFRAEVSSEESDTQLVAQETTFFYADANGGKGK